METIKQAVTFLRKFSASYDVWALAGDSKSTDRQTLMTILEGKKLPKAKCGVNVLREKLWTAAGVIKQGVCQAEQQTLFTAWCKQLIGDLTRTPAECILMVEELSGESTVMPEMLTEQKELRALIKSGKDKATCLAWINEHF